MTSSLYVEFTRSQWSRLRADTPLTLTEQDLRRLRGLNERVSVDEVVEIYLPLSRLLNLHAAATKARILRELLARWPQHPRVDLVTTDGFLYPRRILEGRGLLSRKGFPESYDRRALVTFLRRLKAGDPTLRCPVYSHLTYDIVPDAFTSIDGVRQWYVERFLALRATAFTDPSSYFHRYASLTDDEARRVAADIWDEDQRTEPPPEHPSDSRARRLDPREGRRPRDTARAPSQALKQT